ncbi:hypothetical protein [Paenibacillus harenae]|uniref:hypothetical protein n=1 Tax=Paenibacillus harenae TaxID=306543 RepID=UPI00278DE235|nr:hypothetical protein [Paenibacillus harenae]MDQ0062349.1 hypothetical protein [Paenibacillus harenae]
MIKLTAIITDGPVYLEADQIRAVYTDKGKTNVVCGAVAYPVMESPEVVVRLMTDAKHRKMKLQAAYTYTGKYLDPYALEQEDIYHEPS